MLNVTHKDTWSITLRGLERLGWLTVSETEKRPGHTWDVTLSGRALQTNLITHSKIRSAIAEVGWGWHTLSHVDADCWLFGGPNGASGNVIDWVRGKAELTDEACMAILLVSAYGTTGANELYFAEVADGKTSERVRA
jgi:hypothetical protein